MGHLFLGLKKLKGLKYPGPQPEEKGEKGKGGRFPSWKEAEGGMESLARN